MSLLDLKTKEKRDTALTVRLSATTIEKLKTIAKKRKVSQADLIEHFIESAYVELERSHKPNRK